MQSEASVTIARPIDEVFHYTNEHVAEWSKTVTRIEPIDEGEPGVGSRSRVITEDSGHRMEFDCVVSVWDPPNASAVKMSGKSFDLVAHYAFTDLGGSTLVTQRSLARGKGVVRVVTFLFGWMFKKRACQAQESELDNLKQLLESGAAGRAGTDA